MKKLLLCLALSLTLFACSGTDTQTSDVAPFSTANRANLTIYTAPLESDDAIVLAETESDDAADEGLETYAFAFEESKIAILAGLDGISSLSGETVEEGDFEGRYYIVRNKADNSSLHLYEDGHTVLVALRERTVTYYDSEDYATYFNAIADGITTYEKANEELNAEITA